MNVIKRAYQLYEFFKYIIIPQIDLDKGLDSGFYFNPEPSEGEMRRMHKKFLKKANRVIEERGLPIRL